MTNSSDPAQTAKNCQILVHNFVRRTLQILEFYGIKNLNIMHNIMRKKYILTWFLKVKKTTFFLEYCSNWLRLITLCENITLFIRPDC